MTYPAGIYIAEDGRAHVPVGSTGTTAAPTTGTGRVGDILQDTTGGLWSCTSAGTPGTWHKAGSGAVDAQGLLPTGYLHMSHPRFIPRTTAATYRTAIPYAQLVYFPQAITITTISQLCAGGTSFAGMTSLWFEVWDTTRLIVAKTNDDGATGWTNGTTKALNLTTPYPVAAGTSLYIAACPVYSSTNGTTLGVSSSNFNDGAFPPIVSGFSSDTGVTYAGAVVNTTTRGAITNNTFQAVCYFS